MSSAIIRSVLGLCLLLVAGLPPASAQFVPIGSHPAPIAAGHDATYVVSASRPVVLAPAPPPPARLLGTFYPTPMLNVTGSGHQTGGYSPLDMFGASPLALYGPLSSFRVKSAPVLTYTRGYDGILRPTMGVSHSYPNYPSISPVVYPTAANSVHGFPTTGVPPWWKSATNWIDQQ